MAAKADGAFKVDEGAAAATTAIRARVTQTLAKGDADAAASKLLTKLSAALQ